MAPQLTGTGSLTLAHLLTGSLVTGSLANWLMTFHWVSGFLDFRFSGLLVFLSLDSAAFCSALPGSAFSGSFVAQKDISFSIGKDFTAIFAVLLEKRFFFYLIFCHCSPCIHVSLIIPIAIWLQRHCSRDLVQLILITLIHYASSTSLLRCKQSSTRDPVKSAPTKMVHPYKLDFFTDSFRKNYSFYFRFSIVLKLFC